MKALVTGGSGYIGSHLVKHLLANNIQTVVYDNLYSGQLKNLESVWNDLEFIQGDICDYDSLLKAMDKIDFVFHQAALVSVPESIIKPKLTQEINIMGSFNVLQAALKTQVSRVIVASSCAVYGDQYQPPLRQNIALEGSELGKVDLYGKNYPKNLAIIENSRDNDWHNKKFTILQKYHFNLCFENTIADYYCTEKIWDSIICGCLPIYYGGENSTIYEDFEKNSFLDYTNFKNPNQLFEYIEKMTREEFNERLNMCIQTVNNIVKKINNLNPTKIIVDNINKKLKSIMAISLTDNIQKQTSKIMINLKDSKCVFLITQARSGSTLLMRLLNTIDGYNICGENKGSLIELHKFYQKLIYTIVIGPTNQSRESNQLSSDNRFLSYQELLEKQNKMKHYSGFEFYNVFEFETIQEKLRELIVAMFNPEGIYQVWGFKEVCYGRKDNNTVFGEVHDNYNEFENELNFLKELFPNTKFIFNTRNVENVVKSVWWGDNPEKSREILTQQEQFFPQYHQKYPQFTYHICYEDVINNTDKLQGMYQFLGAEFNLDFYKSVLARR